jgi:hypothetical protein
MRSPLAAPRPRGARTVAAAALFAAAVWLAGCGPSGPQKGVVEGQVTFKGVPVTEGTVSFQRPGSAAEAPLGPEGRYSITEDGGLPVGQYTITVTPATFVDTSDPKLPPNTVAERKAPNIPEKYRREGSTPLKETVQPGKNVFNFELKP